MAAAKEHLAAVKEHLDTPQPQPYVWSFPGAPIRIHLSLDVVERLTLRFRVNNGAASFGLLQGRVDGLTTIVTGVLPLASAEAAEIERTVGKLAAPSSHSVVGFYRSLPPSQQPEDLRLNEKDMALANTFFGNSSSVILLVQPSTAGPANATFFFRDGGHLNGDFAFLEFPFDAHQLGIAAKRRAEDPQRGPLEVLPLAPTRTQSRGPGQSQGIWKGVAWSLLAACVGGGAAVGVRFFLERSHWTPAVSAPPQPVTTIAAPLPSLGLQAERQNGDLKVTWNRESAEISNATLGVISIKDGNSHRTISLQAAQVRSGSLLYSPMSDQVQMDLAVATPTGSVTDSVLVLLPKAGPVQTVAVRPPQPATLPAAALPAPAWPARPAAPQSTSRVEPAKPFTPPPDRQRESTAAAAPYEPPVLTAEAHPEQLIAAPLNHPALTLQPPPPPAAASAPPSRPAPVAAPVYHAAEPLYQARPIFPVSLKNVVTRPMTVEVLVSIDETGKVVKADPQAQTGVHPMLQVSAATAARQWKFSPAHQGDRPVPSQMLLRFNFTPLR